MKSLVQGIIQRLNPQIFNFDGKTAAERKAHIKKCVAEQLSGGHWIMGDQVRIISTHLHDDSHSLMTIGHVLQPSDKRPDHCIFLCAS
jgi:hypothetical protein